MYTIYGNLLYIMKQTSGALSFLLSAYRSVFSSAYAKGIAAAVVLTAGLSAGAAQAAVTGVTSWEAAVTASEDGKTITNDGTDGSKLNIDASSAAVSVTDATGTVNLGVTESGNPHVITTGNSYGVTINTSSAAAGAVDAVLNLSGELQFNMAGTSANIALDLDEINLLTGAKLSTGGTRASGSITLAADRMTIGEGVTVTTGTSANEIDALGKSGASVTIAGTVINSATGADKGVLANTITVQKGGVFYQKSGALDLSTAAGADDTALDETLIVKDGGLFAVSGAYTISGADTIRIEGTNGLQAATGGALAFKDSSASLELSSAALKNFLTAGDAAKVDGVFASEKADVDGKITLGDGSVVFLDEELNYKDIDALVSTSDGAGKIVSQASDNGSLVFNTLTVDQATTNSTNVNLVAGDLSLGAASIANNAITFDSITVKNSLKAVAYDDNNAGTADYRDIADLVLTRDDGETGTVTGPVNVTGTFAASEGVWEVESLKIASTATSAAVSAAADKSVKVTVGNLDLDADFKVGNDSAASNAELFVTGTLDIAKDKTLTVQQSGAGTGVLDLTEAQLVNDTSKAAGDVKGTIETSDKGVVRITGETLSAAIADTDGSADTAANKGYKFDIAANGTLEVTEGDITLNAGDLVGTGLSDSGIQLASDATLKAENSQLTLRSTVTTANATDVGSAGVSGSVSVQNLVLASELGSSASYGTTGLTYTLTDGDWTVSDGVSVTRNGTADSSVAVKVGSTEAATLRLNAANEAKHTVANDIVLGNAGSALTVKNGNWTFADVDATKGKFTVDVVDFGGVVSVKDLKTAANSVEVNGDDLKVTGTLTGSAQNAVKINDGGSLEVSKLALSAAAGVVSASNGSTVTVAAGDVIEKSGETYAVKSSSYYAGAIATDGTSVLNLSGLSAITGGDVTAAEFVSIKNAVLGTGPASGGLSLGVGISDLGTGTDIAYDGADVDDVDAKMLAGNADALVNRRVTGVPGDVITTANFWGSAQLASGVSALNIDTGSVSLKNAATNNDMFVSTSDNKLAGVNFTGNGTVLFRGNGSVGAIDAASAGKGTAIFQAGTIDVQGKFGGTAALGTVEVQDDAVVSSWGGSVQNLNVYGTLTVSQDADKTAGTGDLTVTTAFDLDGGSLSVSGDLDVSAVTVTEGAGTINVGGDFKVGDFKLTDTSYVNVGALVIDNDNTFINDPAWTSGPSVVVADDVKTAADAAGTLGGNWVTGQNSLSYLGEDEAGAGVQALAASLSETGVKARFVLDKSLTVGDGNSATDKLVVDGDVTAESWDASGYTGNGVYVQNGSELIITRNAFGEDGTGTAITLANTTTNAVTVDDTSKIVLKGVEVVNGKEYHLFSGTGTTYTIADGSIVLANGLFSGTFANGNYTIAYDQAKADATLAQTDSSIKNMLETYAQRTDKTGVFDVEADGAVGFVSRAVELGNAASVGKSLDSAAQFVTAGGVPQVSLMAQKAGVNAIESRMGFNGAVASTIGEVQGTDATVWVTPLYSSFESDSFDMGAQEGGVDADLFGVAVGSDFMVADALRLGVAFNVGSGDSDSEGDLASTSNDFEFLGANLYGGYEYGALAIMADLGYTMVSSDIDQSNAAGALSADIDSTVFSVGVQGRYVFDVSGFDIAPHLGVRYTRVDIEDYTVSGVLDGDSVDQSLVTFPVGVTFSKDIIAGDWDVKPVLDLSVIPAAGDTDVDVDSTFINMGDVSVNSEIVDSVSFGGKLGIEAEYGSFGLGLSYQYLGSSNVDSHNVMGNVRYSF